MSFVRSSKLWFIPSQTQNWDQNQWLRAEWRQLLSLLYKVTSALLLTKVRATNQLLYIRCIGSFIMIIDYRLSEPSIEVLKFLNPWSGKLTYNLVKFLAAPKIKLNNELASWDIAMSVYWIITRTKKQAQNAFFLHSPDGRPPPCLPK